MKKTILPLLLSPVLLLSSCGLFDVEVYKKNSINAEGEIITREYDFDSDKFVCKYISVMSNGVQSFPNVHLIESEEKKIVVSMQESLFDIITIKYDETDDKIKIYGNSMDIYYTSKIDIDVYGYNFSYVAVNEINMEIDEGTLSSNDITFNAEKRSNIVINKLKCDSLTLNEQEDSNITFNELEAKNFTCTIGANSDMTMKATLDTFTLTQTGSSNIYPTGFTSSMVAIISSTSAFRGSSFYANTCKITESGACDVTISFYSSLVGTVTGASTLTYYGDKSLVNVTTDELSELIDVVDY